MLPGEGETAKWQRLAELVRRAEAVGLTGLPVRELEELGRLYRQAALALARESTHGRDPRLTEYLNALVARAHSAVYGRRRQEGLHLGRFFAVEIPQTCRAHLDAVLLATALFVLFGLLAYGLVRSDERWGDLLSPGAATVARRFAETRQPAGEYFAETARTLGSGNLSAFILANNVKAAFNAFALGLTLGLGTILVLFLNGMMLGVFMGVGQQQGALMDMLAVVAPHGVLEICAFLVAAAAGLVVGASLAAPGDLTRAQSLVQGARQALRLALGAVPLLLVAALVEGLLSPQSAGLFSENAVRVAFGLALGGLGLAYLFAGDLLAATLRR